MGVSPDYFQLNNTTMIRLFIIISLLVYIGSINKKHKKQMVPMVNIEEESHQVVYDTFGLDSAMIVTKYRKDQWLRKFN